MTNSGDGCCAPGGDHVAGDHDVESSAPRKPAGHVVVTTPAWISRA